MSSQRTPLPDVALVAFDIDGVFTDGRFYLSDDGIESKAFHTQDGYGVRQLLDAGIAVAVISGRASAAVQQRMAELGVRHVYLDCKDKPAALSSLAGELDVSLARCVFVGDDMPDLPTLELAGFSIAVANAVPALKEACDYVTRAAGGYGAVREVCELVLASRPVE